MKVKDLINLYRDDLKEYLIIEIRENNNNLIEFNVNKRTVSTKIVSINRISVMPKEKNLKGIIVEKIITKISIIIPIILIVAP